MGACRAARFGFVFAPAHPFNHRPLSKLLHPLRDLLRDSRTREFLAWMLPALLLGLALRVALTAQLPYGIYHDDTPDFLTTPDRLLHDHRFELHSKKTFLVPIVFTIPFVLHLPALVVIPLIQHFFGMVMVLLLGLLVRLWFRAWKIFIIPLTVLATANPFFLWYEHTLMAESLFLFTTVLLAVAGTLYTLDQSRGRFGFLLAALFLEAGARPEGKLLFGFGIVLVALIHLRGWRSAWPRVAIVAALAVVTNFLTQTSQAGLLLYTSVARLTPATLKCAPGFDPYIAALRADLQRRWAEKPSFPKVRDRRAVSDAVERYLRENPEAAKAKSHRSVNDFCRTLAAETCVKNFAYLPIHIYHKFRAVAVEAPGGRLDDEWLFGQQRDAYSGSPRTLNLARGLTGEKITTDEELRQFFDTHYGAVPWFSALQEGWLKAVNFFRFPDLRVPNPDYPTVPLYHPGVPYYFVAAALGLVVVALRRDRLQAFHFVWAITLLGFFYTIMLTANVRPRFRIVFEPFWFIYIALLVECAVLAATAPFRRRP
jgi:hypothetical protein